MLVQIKNSPSECIGEIQLLKFENQLRICGVPESHDQNTNPNYESEEDTKLGNNSKPGKEEGRSTHKIKFEEKIEASGSHGWENYANQENTSSSATGGIHRDKNQGCYSYHM
ncbi:uncharacterized protein LOC111367393 [Olea europaea var. sylvestris]|uniref:uncharacterized protein LOC111367393 n=1 Tax=Olea europaea var. sylvestris TaxID=158386 RepID=UPI000C1D5FBA|nr:uncharacterized protein LOC111367393 [Olea europaea var. sylvestris]XP_022844007.1 uncharacterized protein LOC111367393 [Olea europaea var. sylvestris]XP_022844008.1 uncharacterized protein LOC111367393 [Olea europaea var. sylvestris]XP_022844009.1 uncharacterized protein LOC111367393 [Olea europaea var. sylvestris]XP_022844010.1 uncharacterized protein LOC111367393 [Olea europaea var. sylvestris]XP_022844011.1 uncharacterized protein LOC111367393 [Olea europaea var. sylvestris]